VLVYSRHFLMQTTPLNRYSIFKDTAITDTSLLRILCCTLGLEGGGGGLTNAPVGRCGWGTDPGPVLNPIFFLPYSRQYSDFSDPRHLTQNHILFILGATDNSRACSPAYVLGILIFLLSTQPSAGNRSAKACKRNRRYPG